MLARILNFYVDGFRRMTVGRTLWAVIGLKLFIMFAVLRLFFFPAFLRGTPEQKENAVSGELTQRLAP